MISVLRLLVPLALLVWCSRGACPTTFNDVGGVYTCDTPQPVSVQSTGALSTVVVTITSDVGTISLSGGGSVAIIFMNTSSSIVSSSLAITTTSAMASLSISFGSSWTTQRTILSTANGLGPSAIDFKVGIASTVQCLGAGCSLLSIATSVASVSTQLYGAVATKGSVFQFLSDVSNAQFFATANIDSGDGYVEIGGSFSSSSFVLTSSGSPLQAITVGSKGLLKVTGATSSLLSVSTTAVSIRSSTADALLSFGSATFSNNQFMFGSATTMVGGNAAQLYLAAGTSVSACLLSTSGATFSTSGRTNWWFAGSLTGSANSVRITSSAFTSSFTNIMLASVAANGGLLLFDKSTFTSSAGNSSSVNIAVSALGNNVMNFTSCTLLSTTLGYVFEIGGAVAGSVVNLTSSVAKSSTVFKVTGANSVIAIVSSGSNVVGSNALISTADAGCIVSIGGTGIVSSMSGVVAASESSVPSLFVTPSTPSSISLSGPLFSIMGAAPLTFASATISIGGTVYMSSLVSAAMISGVSLTVNGGVVNAVSSILVASTAVSSTSIAFLSSSVITGYSSIIASPVMSGVSFAVSSGATVFKGSAFTSATIIGCTASFESSRFTVGALFANATSFSDNLVRFNSSIVVVTSGSLLASMTISRSNISLASSTVWASGSAISCNGTMSDSNVTVMSSTFGVASGAYTFNISGTLTNSAIAMNGSTISGGTVAQIFVARSVSLTLSATFVTFTGGQTNVMLPSATGLSISIRSSTLNATQYNFLFSYLSVGSGGVAMIQDSVLQSSLCNIALLSGPPTDGPISIIGTSFTTSDNAMTISGTAVVGTVSVLRCAFNLQQASAKSLTSIVDVQSSGSSSLTIVCADSSFSFLPGVSPSWLSVITLEGGSSLSSSVMSVVGSSFECTGARASSCVVTTLVAGTDTSTMDHSSVVMRGNKFNAKSKHADDVGSAVFIVVNASATWSTVSISIQCMSLNSIDTSYSPISVSGTLTSCTLAVDSVMVGNLTYGGSTSLIDLKTAHVTSMSVSLLNSILHLLPLRLTAPTTPSSVTLTFGCSFMGSGPLSTSYFPAAANFQSFSRISSCIKPSDRACYMTPSPSATRESSASRSATASPTDEVTSSDSHELTMSTSVTSSVTLSSTQSLTATHSVTRSEEATLSHTPAPTVTLSDARTSSKSSTLPPTPSKSPVETPSHSLSPSTSVSESPSPSSTLSVSATLTPNPTPSPTEQMSQSKSHSGSLSAAYSRSVSRSLPSTVSRSLMPTATILWITKTALYTFSVSASDHQSRTRSAETFTREETRSTREHVSHSATPSSSLMFSVTLWLTESRTVTVTNSLTSRTRIPSETYSIVPQLFVTTTSVVEVALSGTQWDSLVKTDLYGSLYSTILDSVSLALGLPKNSGVKIESLRVASLHITLSITRTAKQPIAESGILAILNNSNTFTKVTEMYRIKTNEFSELIGVSYPTPAPTSKPFPVVIAAAGGGGGGFGLIVLGLVVYFCCIRGKIRKDNGNAPPTKPDIPSFDNETADEQTAVVPVLEMTTIAGQDEAQADGALTPPSSREQTPIHHSSITIKSPDHNDPFDEHPIAAEPSTQERVLIEEDDGNDAMKRQMTMCAANIEKIDRALMDESPSYRRQWSPRKEDFNDVSPTRTPDATDNEVGVPRTASRGAAVLSSHQEGVELDNLGDEGPPRVQTQRHMRSAQNPTDGETVQFESGSDDSSSSASTESEVAEMATSLMQRIRQSMRNLKAREHERPF